MVYCSSTPRTLSVELAVNLCPYIIDDSLVIIHELHLAFFLYVLRKQCELGLRKEIGLGVLP